MFLRTFFITIAAGVFLGFAATAGGAAAAIYLKLDENEATDDNIKLPLPPTIPNTLLLKD